MSISIKNSKSETVRDNALPFAAIRGARNKKVEGTTFYLNPRSYAKNTKGDHLAERESDSDKDEGDLAASLSVVSEVEVPDGNLSLVPMNSDRDVIYAFAKSGSGKSVWVGNYMAEYQHKYPKNPIFLFSEKDEDPAFEGVKHTRIPLSNLWDQKRKEQRFLAVKDFPDDCLCVFDDVDALKPKQLAESVQHCYDNLLVNGRSHHISVIVTSHLGAANNRTKTILNEMHTVVIFPHYSQPRAIQYVLSEYAHLSNSEINKLMKLPSRWVAVRCIDPYTVIYTSGAYIVDLKDFKE